MVESGLFYSTIIDPLLRQLRKQVASEVKSGENVIDIACGTGEQVFDLVEKAESVTGIDLSASMVKHANRVMHQRKIRNASIEVADATDLSAYYHKNFDVAVLSMALHQFHAELQKPILEEIKKVARRVIILDYATPLPRNVVGRVCKVAEFLAGIEHNRNFKKYTKAGGIDAVLAANGFEVQKTKYFGKGAFSLVVAKH